MRGASCGPEAVGLALLDEAGLREHVRVLHRILAEHAHLAGGGEDLPGQQLHQGGLAGAVAAQQAVHAPFGEVEGDVLKGGDVAEVLANGLDGIHCRASIISVSSRGSMPRWAASRSSGTR